MSPNDRSPQASVGPPALVGRRLPSTPAAPPSPALEVRAWRWWARPQSLLREESHSRADVGSDGAHSIEQLEDEPRAQNCPCRKPDGRDEEEEDQRQNPASGEHHDVGPEDAGYGSGSAEVRNHRVGIDQELTDRGRDPGREVEEEVQDRSQLVFDVVPEDPQEQHVAADVQPPPVKEHRHEHRLPPRLVRTRPIEKALKARVVSGTSSTQGFLPRQLPESRPVSLGDARLVAHLVRHFSVAIEEGDLPLILVPPRGESGLPEHERHHVESDDDERDQWEVASGIVVVQWEHRSILAACRFHASFRRRRRSLKLASMPTWPARYAENIDFLPSTSSTR